MSRYVNSCSRNPAVSRAPAMGSRAQTRAPRRDRDPERRDPYLKLARFASKIGPPTVDDDAPDAEEQRLEEDRRRVRDWKRFGPYLSERQWGTVREDYSPVGDAWGYLPHYHARSRA